MTYIYIYIDKFPRQPLCYTYIVDMHKVEDMICYMTKEYTVSFITRTISYHYTSGHRLTSDIQADMSRNNYRVYCRTDPYTTYQADPAITGTHSYLEIIINITFIIRKRWAGSGTTLRKHSNTLSCVSIQLLIIQEMTNNTTIDIIYKRLINFHFIR